MSEDQNQSISPPDETRPLKTWVKVGYVLLILSVPVLLEVFFEVVLLTLSSGPQMLFYTVIHTVSGPLGVILGVSLLANPAYMLYAFGVLAYRCVGKLAEAGKHFRVMMAWLAFQIIVFFLMFTYDYWAYALFG